jgi:DNA-binding transcriptional ArsR family regulator
MVCDKGESQSMVDRSATQRSDGREREMDKPTEDVGDVETLPPDRAFELLSNETRIAILRVLASADEECLPFSILRKRVGIDDSGQFNYHLNRLAGHYVRRTRDGYIICQTGTDALEAISRL